MYIVQIEFLNAVDTRDSDTGTNIKEKMILHSENCNVVRRSSNAVRKIKQLEENKKGQRKQSNLLAERESFLKVVHTDGMYLFLSSY